MRFSCWIFLLLVPALRESCDSRANSGGYSRAGEVVHFPFQYLVGVIPLVFLGSREGDIGPAAGRSSVQVDSPRQLKHVGRTPAGDLVVAWPRTERRQLILIGQVVGIAT